MDESNAFAKAPLPKQQFYMRPDTQFNNWWTKCLGRNPIPPGYVLLVLHALQGHPEAPQLWERHVTKILQGMGLTATTHKPCIYLGTIRGQKVLMKQQVDDFAIGTRSSDIADYVWDKLDKHFLVLIKCQGLIMHFNGVDVD